MFNSDLIALQEGDVTPGVIKVYLNNVKKLLPRLVLFKDSERTSRYAEYESQLLEMRNTVLKNQVAAIEGSKLYCLPLSIL